MNDLGFITVFALLALGAALLVNSFIALLSGEHPRDTKSVWLDIMLGELRGFSSAFSLFRPQWLRWTVAVVLGIAVFLSLYFGLYAD
jgi:hypothetical protein